MAYFSIHPMEQGSKLWPCCVPCPRIYDATHTGFSYVFSQEVNIRCIFGRVIRQKILGAKRRVFDVCLMHFKWIALVIRTYAISLSSISIDAAMWQGDRNHRIHPLPSDLVFPSRRLSGIPNCTFISDTLMRCVLYRWWARVLFLLR